ncbi:MAG: N-acetyl-gamma-glutamyl-phosphate reductase [Thermodesulfobacteriota bacterium]
MIRTGIIGVSGYAGGELARIVHQHDGIELTVATSRQYSGRKLSEIYPNLKGTTDLVCENLSPKEVAERADFLFTAVPSHTAMEIIPPLLEAGKKVVDLSADFRFDSATVYEKWYGRSHSAEEYLKEAVYGLPEINRSSIASARLVANPGCYSTSIILGLVPLLKLDLINLRSIVADSKSGASGAGRGAKTAHLFCEVTDGVRAYAIGRHRHTPEIEQELAKLAGRDMTISFSPHLLPLSRGINSTIYAEMKDKMSQEDIAKIYNKNYADEFFIRLCESGIFPATQNVRGSNFCDIGFQTDPRTGRIVVLSVIDNLVKGASGQAVQNMNLMCGFREETGLDIVPLFP